MKTEEEKKLAEKISAKKRRDKIKNTPELYEKKKADGRAYYLGHKEVMKANARRAYWRDPEKAKNNAKQWMKDHRTVKARKANPKTKDRKSYYQEYIDKMTPEQFAAHRLKISEYNKKYKVAQRKPKPEIKAPEKEPNVFTHHTNKHIEEIMNKWNELKAHGR